MLSPPQGKAQYSADSCPDSCQATCKACSVVGGETVGLHLHNTVANDTTWRPEPACQCSRDLCDNATNRTAASVAATAKAGIPLSMAGLQQGRQTESNWAYY